MPLGFVQDSFSRGEHDCVVLLIVGPTLHDLKVSATPTRVRQRGLRDFHPKTLVLGSRGELLLELLGSEGACVEASEEGLFFGAESGQSAVLHRVRRLARCEGHVDVLLG